MGHSAPHGFGPRKPGQETDPATWPKMGTKSRLAYKKNHEAVRRKLRMLLASTLDMQRHVLWSHDGHHARRIGSSGAQQDLQEATCACDLSMGRRLLSTFGPHYHGHGVRKAPEPVQAGGMMPASHVMPSLSRLGHKCCQQTKRNSKHERAYPRNATLAASCCRRHTAALRGCRLFSDTARKTSSADAGRCSQCQRASPAERRYLRFRRRLLCYDTRNICPVRLHQNSGNGWGDASYYTWPNAAVMHLALA